MQSTPFRVRHGIIVETSSNTSTAIVANNQVLTGSASSTLVDLATAWNTTGNPTAIKLNVTNTASGANSALMDLQVGGVSKFKVAANGSVGIGTTSPDANSRIEISGPATTDTTAIKITSAVGNNASVRKGIDISTLGGPNSTYYGLYVNVTSHSGNWAIYAPNGQSYFGSSAEFGQTVSIRGTTDSNIGTLRIGDKTSFTGPGNGGRITFWGDERSQGSDFAAFAGIKGIKENGTYLSSLGALVFETQSVSSFAVGTDLTEKMRITSAGNVAVGRTDANYKVDVAGAVNASAFLVNGQSIISTIDAANTYSNTTYVKLTAPNQTITGSLVIAGNLIASGNTTFVNTENLRVSDPLIYLAGNNYSSDIVDIGFIGNYVNATGQNVHTGLYREHADKMYYLFQGYDAEPLNNHIGALSNNMSLAVLNADLRTSNLTLGGQNTITWITGAFAKANDALPNTSGVSFNGNLNFPTGNVGIGTTAPISRFTVVDSTAKNGTITLGDDVSYHGKLQYIFSTGEFRLSQVGGASLGTTFYTNGSERMRITAAGDINFSNGLIFDRLDTTTRIFNGGTIVYQSNSPELQHQFSSQIGTNFANTLVQIDTGSTDVGNGRNLLLVKHQSANVFVVKSITGGGQVGIGTTAPESNLQISVPYASRYLSTTGRLAVYGGKTILSPAVQSDNNLTVDTLDLIYQKTGAFWAGSQRINFRVFDLGNNADRGTMATITGGQESGLGGAGSGYIAFSTAASSATTSTERLRIDSNGNVGIGTTSPSQKLHLVGTSGNILIRLDDAVNPRNNYIGVDNYEQVVVAANESNTVGATPYIKFRINASELVRILPSGNFGIGTTTPARKLDVYGSGQFSDASGIQTTIWSQAASGTGGVGTNNNYPFTILTNGSERVRIDANGNIGFGTTTPISFGKFAVNSTTNVYGFKNSPSNTLAHIGGNAYTEVDLLIQKPTNTGSAGTIQAGPTLQFGVVYGTNPARTILNNGNILFSGWDGTNFITAASITSQVENTFTTNAGYGNLLFATNYGSAGPTERMRIDANGNVGIGTTAPTEKLVVYSPSNASAAITGGSESNLKLVSGGNGVWWTHYNTNKEVKLWGPGFTGTLFHANTDTYLVTIPGAQSVQGGRVWITNGTGASNVQIHGTYTDVSNYERLNLTANSSGHYIIGQQAGTGSARSLYLGSNNVTRMTITDDGNVGIGTTSPSQKLHISGGHALIGGTYGLYFNDGSTARIVYDQGQYRIHGIGSTIPIVFLTNSIERMLISNTGNVGIGTTTPGYKLEVAGSFAAQTKSFIINHQSKPNHKLCHGSLEGPENGVYVRGRTNTNVIELPEYWTWLVDDESITVTLTSIGTHQNLYVEKIEDNKVYIAGEANINCFYMINAERKDVDKLIVEY